MNLHPTFSHRLSRRRGVSLVELMVGVTIGLFILAAATLVVTSQLGDNRRMLTDTQLQQDMRATLDIATRDIRRAGYWAHGWNNVWAASPAQAMGNPYTAINAARDVKKGDSIAYARSLDEEGGGQSGSDNDTVDENERAGFRFNAAAGTVEMLVGTDNWQALTDPAVMKVTQFDITLTSRSLALPCGTQCLRGPAGCPLELLVRDASIVMSAEAAHDSNIKRSAQTNVRLRNDVLVEQAKPC